MEEKGTNEMLSEALENINNIEWYKLILNSGNNLFRFDTFNKILILYQNNKAFDVKTRTEWEIDGRTISKDANAIKIIVPSMKSVYRDIETGRQLDENELTPEEILKAIEHHIITRDDEIEDLIQNEVYDVRDTRKIDDNSEFKPSNPVLDSNTILSLLKDVTGAEFVLCDDEYYSMSDNIIFISKKPYRELAITVSKFLAKYYIDFEIKDIIASTYEIERYAEKELELIKISLEYALETLFHTYEECNFALLKEVNPDVIIEILDMVGNIVSELAYKMNFTSCSNKEDAVTIIQRLKKSEAILNIMEANSINIKLNSI